LAHDAEHPTMSWANGLGRRLALAVGLAVGLVSAGLTEAKSNAEPTEMVVLPESLAHEVVRALVARLSDSEIRGLLQARLDRAATASGLAAADVGLGITMEDDVTRVRQRLGAVLGAAPGLPAELDAAVRRFSATPAASGARSAPCSRGPRSPRAPSRGSSGPSRPSWRLGALARWPGSTPSASTSTPLPCGSGAPGRS
jgi:hypothetical protein